jgi:nucleoside-diphosphate-sugar epimerase
MVLLCFGYGYVAQRLAQRVTGTVFGTTRDGRFGSLAYEDGLFNPPMRDALALATHILISTPPHSGEERLVRAIAAFAPRCRWVGYLSTTGVYGDHQGRVVSETTPIHPPDARTRARAHSETMWRDIGAQVFRLSGIYGPGRSPLDAVRQGTAQRVHKPGHRFSRLHVEDIARALQASMRSPMPGALFNLADDLPAPQSDTVAYACQLLGITPPPLVPFAQATLPHHAQFLC